MDEASSYSRRGFLRRAATGAAHLGVLSALGAAWARELSAAQEHFPVVGAEPWGRIFQLGDGVWALISEPFRDRTTLCNGGIVQGENGVVIIEAFGSNEGFDWMAGEARRLTGSDPTDVVVTHYHGDHTAGLEAAWRAGASIHATPVTRDYTRMNEQVPDSVLNRAKPLDTIRPTEIDLGDRSLVIVPRRGHTDSDLTVELAEPKVVFCGDLVWNEMFPNYVDATPSRLAQAVALIRASEASVYVPGHGPLASLESLDRYVELLDYVQEAAMTAVQEGLSPEEAGGAFRLPEAMEGWTTFSDDYYAVAIAAWMDELGRP